MRLLADVSDMPDISWVAAAFLAGIWFIGAFLIVYRTAVVFNGRGSLPTVVGAAALFAAWTFALSWLALASLPE